MTCDSVNAREKEFWNSDHGLLWVRFQKDLDALHEGVTAALLAAARPVPGERVLDVGCGAGAQSFAIARAVGPEGGVTGVDVSAPLLAKAEERRASLGIDNVAFRHGDAATEKFDTAFDLMASRFGVMFFDDPVAAFRNLAVALVPGGRLAFVAWQGPEHNPWFTLPHEVAVARLGQGATAPPDAPGPMAFRDANRVLGILTDAGFADASVESVEIELHHPGGVDAAVNLATRVGPVSRLLREKGGTEADREAIGSALVTAFEAYRSPDGRFAPDQPLPTSV